MVGRGDECRRNFHEEQDFRLFEVFGLCLLYVLGVLSQMGFACLCASCRFGFGFLAFLNLSSFVHWHYLSYSAISDN